MPYQRPGQSVYVKNASDGIYLHGQPVCEARGSNFEVGIAVKQVPAHWSDGLTAQNQIQIGEPYLILRNGVVMVEDTGQGFVDGDEVYISETTNALSKNDAGAGLLKFGKVVEVPGDGRGVPTGMVRVNLDERNSF
jgi:hypothetical protein